jgi:hypothetical protein
MNLCVYDTVKHVQVRDARLAVLRYFFLLAIGIYVCVFELWAFGGWLDSSPVVGVVRFSLQQPTVNGCNPELPNCTNAFSRLDELSYCSQFYGNKSHTQKKRKNHTADDDEYPGNVYNCKVYEAINAQIMSEKSLVVITRGFTSEQSLVCTDDMMTCPRTYQSTSEDEEDKFYTAQPESFTVLLDHAVTASKLCSRQEQQVGAYACFSDSSKYRGRMYSKSRELCMEHKEHAFAHYIGDARSSTAPCYIQPNSTSDTGQDFFSLNVLLRASGIQLDDCNINYNHNDDVTMEEEEERVADQASPYCQTFRETGATILLNVYWNDFVPYYGKVEPYYYYSPVFIGGTFKQYIPFYHVSETQCHRLTVFFLFETEAEQLTFRRIIVLVALSRFSHFA